MARTVVYPVQTRGGGVLSDADGQTGDPYTDKIAKYVPAEVLAFFLPITVLVGQDNTLLLIAFIVGLVGTPLYLWVSSPKDTAAKKPRPYFYVLAVLAFAAWALGTSSTIAKLFGLDPTAATFWLAVAVFLLPGIDEGLTRINL